MMQCNNAMMQCNDAMQLCNAIMRVILYNNIRAIVQCNIAMQYCHAILQYNNFSNKFPSFLQLILMRMGGTIYPWIKTPNPVAGRPCKVSIFARYANNRLEFRSSKVDFSSIITIRKRTSEGRSSTPANAYPELRSSRDDLS